MMTVRFTNLVLGFLFTLLVLSDSFMHTQPAVAMMTEENADGFAVTGRDIITIKQELFDSVSSTYATRNKKLGGRKLVVDFDFKNIAKDAGLQRETSKISGEDTNASEEPLGGSTNIMNDQNDGNKVEMTKFNSESMKVHSRLLKTSSYVEPHEPFKQNESKRLLEAATEIANLMHKDYRGMGKRKPPINNHQPLNDNDMKP